MVDVSDYWLAAYVMAAGVRLISTRRGQDGWLTFSFEPAATKAIERWQSGKAVIDARAYRSVVRKLRTAVRAA